MAWHLELPKFLRTHKATGAAWDLMNEIPWTDTASLSCVGFLCGPASTAAHPPHVSLKGLHAVSLVTSKQDFYDVVTGSFVKLPIDEPIDGMARDRGASIGLFEVTGDCSHIIN